MHRRGSTLSERSRIRHFSKLRSTRQSNWSLSSMWHLLGIRSSYLLWHWISLDDPRYCYYYDIHPTTTKERKSLTESVRQIFTNSRQYKGEKSSTHFPFMIVH